MGDGFLSKELLCNWFRLYEGIFNKARHQHTYAVTSALLIATNLVLDVLKYSDPPHLDAYLPGMDDTEEGVHGRDIVDVDIDELLAEAYSQSRTNTVSITKRKQEEKEQMLTEQEKTSPWHGFCNPNELILKTGLIDKRRGMFAKRRQLVLTDTPRLFYIDPVSLAVMGEIPWSKEIKVQYRNPKLFFVHTPDRTYYLEDVDRAAITWVDAIQKVLLL